MRVRGGRGDGVEVEIVGGREGGREWGWRRVRTPSFFLCLECATVFHLHLLGGAATSRAHTLNGLHNGQGAIRDLPKDHMLAVQPASCLQGDEELRTIGVGASISHGQDTRSSMLLLKVLISKLLPVDALATGSVAASEVSGLAHEVRDHPVEDGAFVAEPLLPRAQSTEVRGSLRSDIIIQLELDSAGRLSADGHVEEAIRLRHGGQKSSSCERNGDKRNRRSGWR